ncbi:hypothetical protein AB205_0027780, partial [Aquarana catesbeiana]
ILCCLLILGITGSPVCVHQVKTRTVQSGGSVTIPCSYVNPRKPDEDVRVIWGETDGEYCSSGKDIIVSSSGKVTEKYKGRLYREKDPYRNRTEYITITGLESTKRQRFCCQLYNMSHNYVFKDSIQGTLLQFTDTEYITQLDEVMAVSGEEVIIPCYYSKNTSTLTKVTWYYAKEHTTCTDTRIQEWSNAHQYGRYSVVNFKQDVSLRIHNIKLYDQQSFCCVISTSNKGETLESKQFTMLIVADYQPSWDQPTNEISVQEGHSVLLSCSYTLPSDQYTERDVLRVNVYWRVGNVTGLYAYHPYQEMVHSTYRHRTSITEMINLMIKGVTKADNTSFYCFVVVKLCKGDNQCEDKIQYGGGTKLNINEPPQMSHIGRETLILAAYLAVKFFFTVILVVLGCVYGRAKSTKRST